jgi:hypothetical protein
MTLTIHPGPRAPVWTELAAPATVMKLLVTVEKWRG